MASTLEAIAAAHRRQKPKPRTTVELEARALNPTYEIWASIMAGLLSKKIPVDDGAITQVINVIRDEPAKSRGDSRLASHLIRQMSFADGVKQTDIYMRKQALMAAVRLTNAHALSYTIALSEETTGAQPFNADEGSMVRVKLRAGFTLRLAAETATAGAAAAAAAATHVWRIDMSVVRQITSAEAMSSLPGVKAEMFQKGMTPDTIAARLALHDPVKRASYRFECEIEYVGAAGGATLTPADITAATAQLSHLANPQHVEAAAYQAALHDAAKLIYAKAPGLARQFERESGLKRLAPQVTALTRGAYRAMYPPVGLLATEKRDGKRCLVVARGDRAVVIADKLYSFERKTAAVAATGVTFVDAEFTAPNLIDIFDVMVIGGTDVMASGIEVRSTHAAAAAAVLTAFGLDAVAKPYTTLTKDNLRATLSKLAADEKQNGGADEKQNAARSDEKHDIAARSKKDGIIFAQPGQPYLGTASYKWKPSDQEGIDFLARRCPKSVRGQEPFLDRVGHELHFLFNGINPDLYAALALRPCAGYAELFGRDAMAESYFPIQFQPSDSPMAYLYWHPTSAPPIDGKIVDLRPNRAPAKTGGAPTKTAAVPAKTAAGASKTSMPSAKVVAPAAKVATSTAKVAATPAKTTAAVSLAKAATVASKTAAPAKVAVAASKTSKAAKSAPAPPPLALPREFTDWELMRVREDRDGDLRSNRYFGNDFRVAELTWINTIDPFPAEQLWGEGDAAYFAREKSGIYKAQTAFISFVKTQRIDTLRHSAVVVDLCSGAGADVGRFMAADIRTLIAVEKDRGAAAEMLRRKYSYIARRSERGARGRGAGGRAPRGMALQMIIADVGRPFAETAALIRRAAGGATGTAVADAVVMNLALHYFMGSVESMRNIVALCVETVRVDGVVAFTAMFGEAVHALFQENKIAEGKSWDVRTADGSALKYSLKRMYVGDGLTAAGQKIGVLLPFSDGNYYEEYLVNVFVLEREFHARGFVTVAKPSMSKHLETFQAHNPTVAAELTADDRKYVSLYGELVFRRVR